VQRVGWSWVAQTADSFIGLCKTLRMHQTIQAPRGMCIRIKQAGRRALANSARCLP